MKKVNILMAGFLALSFTARAQQSFNVISNGITYSFPVNADIMTFTGGETLKVQEKTFMLSEIERMEVVNAEYEGGTVSIVYEGDKASVTIAGNISDYIEATVSGAHVIIDQSEEAGEATTGEITYVLSGESDNGSFTQNGSYKSTIELRGLTLTNPLGAAIDIENGKRIDFSSKNGTVNTITDGADGSQKGAIYCKGHLELKGKGTLNVTGNTSHAIAAKEYVEMKNCTVNILGSVKDGINCNQYFLIESGVLNINNPGDDGIQVSFKDDEDREEEDTGSIFINGGEINIMDITATAAKGMKAEGDFYMTGGEISVKSTAPGEWDSSKEKTKASACIGIDGDIDISGGTLNLTATGGGGKGINCDSSLTVNDGNIKILTEGGVLAYVNGALNQNYTGNTDRLDSDYKSSPKGMKIDGEVVVNGGNFDVTTSGNGGEGIESKSILTINDGYVKVRAKDDAINSSGTMYINGGQVDVISTGNDGLDSNGDLYIQGGLVMAFGSSAPECGIDANEEEGYTVYFTGGYILAAGGGNSVPRNSASTQPFVSVNLAMSADAEVSVKSGDDTLYSFKTPADLSNVNLGGGGHGGFPGGMGGGNGSSLLISLPEMVSGDSYTIVTGDTSTSGTARTTGSSGNGGPGWGW